MPDGKHFSFFWKKTKRKTKVTKPDVNDGVQSQPGVQGSVPQISGWWHRQTKSTAASSCSQSTSESTITVTDLSEPQFLQKSEKSTNTNLNQIDTYVSTGLSLATDAAKDPLGLHVVYSPENARQTVDIIFIHGLGGTSQSTWSKHRDPQLFWPAKFLPMEADICQARIMTFGYDANFRNSSGSRGGSTITTVLDFAKDLLFDLKYGKNREKQDLEIGQAPIIFIVHSMGGILVKQAYIQGKHDPEYKEIIKAVSAIIFLSTPHRGTNLAETLNKILRVSCVSTPKQFISELAWNSTTLQNLNEQFRHIAPDLNIVSFYETLKTPMLVQNIKIMVLEKDSSILGYPGEISKSLNADHHEVCKYDSPDDPSYIAVRNVLKSFVAKAITSNFRTGIEREEQKQLEYLFIVSEPPDTDYIFFRDRWMPGTCSWILQEQGFLRWVDDSSCLPKVLWVQGNPASGKSILSSFIINHLVEQDKSCQYFFVRFGDHKKRSLITLLRSLAYQLAYSLPDFRKKILQLFDEASKLQNSDPRYIWQVIFKSILFKMQLKLPIYWVIDGLEESDTPRSFIKLLVDLSSSVAPIRILIASRKTQELTSAFQRLGNAVSVDVMPIIGNDQDFQQFIDHELDLPGDKEYKDEVKNKLLKGADGNFLWVNLAVQRINICHTEDDVEHALDQLPPGMEALYDRMAQRIANHPSSENQHLANTILSWITCSLRSLTLAELSQVLNKDMPQILDIKRSISDLCGGFVVVDLGGNVAIVHKTAREYLVTSKARPFRIDRAAANEQIFLQCMQVLMQPGLRGLLNRKQWPLLLEYAATSWFHHLHNTSPDSPEAFATLVKFLKGSWVLTWIQALAETKKLKAIAAASTYLWSFATKRMERDANILPLDRQISDREHIENWATDLMKIVGKFGTNLLLNPESIYKIIPPFCPTESITYQQFGTKEGVSLQINCPSNANWDDSLTHLNFTQGDFLTQILANGSWIAGLKAEGTVYIYRTSTFEKFRVINHEERLWKMQFNLSGTLLATYGYLTTKVWEVSTGECIMVGKNPASKPRPQTILFSNDMIVVGASDRKIRSMSLSNHCCEYQEVTEINEQQLEGTFVNSPTCMALSPEGKQVALGYRGHPLSVWEVEGPEVVGRCLRTGDFTTTGHGHGHGSGKSARAWGEVTRIIWHPFSGEVLGLYLEGAIFKWHPYEDTNIELQAGASSLTVSHDGNFFATGDANGTVKVFSTADFCLVYQLASPDGVRDLAFSLDSHRVYDLRGSYANVWEPNALVRISEMTERSSDGGSDVASLAQKSIQPTEIPAATMVDPVTVLAAQPSGILYCTGNDEGVAELFQVGRGKQGVLGKTNYMMSTEVMVWSDCGTYVAFTDQSGELFVESIQLIYKRNASPFIKSEFALQLQIDISDGAINQLVFRPNSKMLMVYNKAKVFIVSLEKGEIAGNYDLDTLALGSKAITWINHPANPEMLLGFGPGIIYELAWDDFQTCRTIHCVYPSSHRYHVLPVATSPIQERPKKSIVVAVSPDNTVFKINRVLVTQDKRHIVVQHKHQIDGQSKKAKEYFLFEVSSFTDAQHQKHDVQPLHIPPEISCRIENPISFISSDLLVFLDQNYWVCTWRLGSWYRGIGSPKRNLKPVDVNIKRHYFLPGDWISPASIALCTVMEDGTLLCPRNGDVAEIKCSAILYGK